MTAVEVVGSLSDLAAKANEENRLAIESARVFVAHAIRCGTLLTDAWTRIPAGEWKRWRDDNLDFSTATANFYMRAAMHADHLALSGADTYAEVREALAGLPRLPRKATPIVRWNADVVAEVRRRRSAGESWRAIGEAIGHNAKTVQAMVDPGFAQRARKSQREAQARARRRLRLARQAEERANRDALAKGRSDGLAIAYGDVRHALKALDAAVLSPDDRAHAHVAIQHLHRAEDEIVRAMRAGRQK